MIKVEVTPYNRCENNHAEFISFTEFVRDHLHSYCGLPVTVVPHSAMTIDSIEGGTLEQRNLIRKELNNLWIDFLEPPLF